MNDFIKEKHDDILCHIMHLSRGIERLEQLGEEITVEKGQELNVIGQVPDCCYLVKTGRIIGCEITYSGEVRVYNLMEPNSMFLEGNLLLDAPCPILFKASMPSTLIRIDKCDLKRAFKRDIDVVLDVCESLAAKFLSSMEMMRNDQQKPAGWRICELLLVFSNHYGKPYDGKLLITEKISHQMIADMLGMNRVTVSRILKDLRDLALVEQINGHLCIRSVEAIKDHMDLIC